MGKGIDLGKRECKKDRLHCYGVKVQRKACNMLEMRSISAAEVLEYYVSSQVTETSENLTETQLTSE